MLFAGQLIERKRPEFVLQVIAEVARRVPELHATFIGDGKLRGYLESRCSELGINSNVKFLGQRSDVMDIMGRSKTFILASRSEGVSIAMLEAMASGSVPVVSDVGDLKDFAVHGDSGFVLQPEDLDGFAESVVMLLTDDKLRISLSESATHASQSRTNLASVTDQWRQAVEGIIDSNGKI
jgi:glycosyltransferase involved in cell wall biosynthesis